MKRLSHRFLHSFTSLCLITASALCFVSGAFAAENDDLKDQVESLRQEIEALKSANTTNQYLSHSQQSVNQKLKISGFASAGLVKATEAVGFPNGITDNAWNTQADSILGLQFNFKMNDKMYSAAQISSQGYPDDHQLSTEWYYLAYQLSPAIRLRAGRLQLPFYYYAESVNVGYSYLWARPPSELYIVNTTSAELFELTYSRSIWSRPLELRALFGRNVSTQNLAVIDVNYQMDNMFGFTFKLTGNYLTYHGSFFYVDEFTLLSSKGEDTNITSFAGASNYIMNVTRQAIDSSAEVDAQFLSDFIAQNEANGIAFSPIDPITEAGSEDLDAALNGLTRFSDRNTPLGYKDKSLFCNVGVIFQNNRFMAQSEYIRLFTDQSLLNRMEGSYVLMSYAVTDRITPYISYAFSKSYDNSGRENAAEEFRSSIREIYEEKYTGQPGAALAVIGISNVADLIYSTFLTQSTLKSTTTTLGVRYELLPGAAIKFQWDSSRALDGFVSFNGLGAIDQNTGDVGPDSAQAFSIVIDTVF